MKLSTKGRYGARLMIELASRYGEGPVLLRDISKRQEISEKYLWHVVNSLKTAGLVTTMQGVHGGYYLSKPPSDISMKDILQASEGPICLVDCVDRPASCNRAPSCSARDLWGEISEGINQVLASTTLSDMLKRQKDKTAIATAGDYQI